MWGFRFAARLVVCAGEKDKDNAEAQSSLRFAEKRKREEEEGVVGRDRKNPANR